MRDRIELTKERLSEKTRVEVLDKILVKLKKHLDIRPIKAIRHTFFGSQDMWLWKVKAEVPDLNSLGDEDDNNITKQFNCPPFLSVRVCQQYVGVMVGQKWNFDTSSIAEIDGNHYIEYKVGAKYESVINALILLHSCGINVTEELKVVIFLAVNRLHKVNIDSVELAGMNNIIEECIRTLESKDKRLVNRHILLAGPPGCGKSEIVKELVLRTPEWVHFPLSNDIDDWGEFMRSLNKLMTFIGKRVMIIIDEIDEIGLTRDRDSTKVYDLLRVMDGVTDLGHIKFVATTNRPKVLDPALKRIGRFGPIYVINTPGDDTFRKIIKFYTERYKGKINVEELMEIRDAAVGSEIRAAFEDCIINKEPVTTKNVIKNLTKVMESKKIQNKDYV